MTQTLGKLAVSTGYQHFGLIFWQMVVGVPVLAPFAFWGGRRIVLTAAALRCALVALTGVALVAASIVHGFAYLAYVWLAARAGAVFAAQTSYIRREPESSGPWCCWTRGSRFEAGLRWW